MVTLLRDGRVTRRWRAVVGKPSTPTPTGLFSVYQRVRQTDPNAFLGSWALLLSGFSNVLRRLDGGPGRFAIHGRGGASARPARDGSLTRVHPDRQPRDRRARRRRRHGTPVRIG